MAAGRRDHAGILRRVSPARAGPSGSESGASGSKGAELTRFRDGVGPRGRAELGEDIANVHVHGSRGEEERSRDLAVRPLSRDEPENVELAARETAGLERAKRLAAQPSLDA